MMRVGTPIVGSRLADGRLMPCFGRLLAGGCRVRDFPLGLLQLTGARADVDEPVTDLMAAALPAL